jgi:hypothetical protein
MNDYNIGDYGRFSFTTRKKRKYPLAGEPYIIMGFDLCGKVIESDNKNIIIQDNDDMIYLVAKKYIRSYKAEKQP